MWLTIGTLALAGGFPSVDEPLKTGLSSPGDAAVVVGLEDYAFVADVPYARRDAQAVYDWLVYTRGVPSSQVQLLTSGGREQVVGALGRAVDQVGAGGTLWVYFAGHGAASTSDGRRMLLGDDVRQDPAAFDARAIPLDEVKALAAETGGPLVLVVDACYNGVGRGGAEIVAGKRFAVPAYATRPAPKVAEWTAASADQLSGPLEAAQHGAFTYFALGALRGWADGHLDGAPDGQVTAEEARLYVASALRSAQILDQTPVLTADQPAAWVLSTAREAAPVIGGAPPAAPAPAPAAGLDTSRDADVTRALQGIVDQCASENAGGDAAAETWYIRFKVKAGAIKNLMLGDPGAAQAPAGGELPDIDPNTASRALCLRREIKELAPSGPDVVVTRTLRTSR